MEEPSSERGLSEGLQQLASTLMLDAEATIRVDLAAMTSVPESTGRLPRLQLTGGVDADLHVVGILGKGGMGEVRLARQRALDRDVAVKMINAGARSDFRAALLVQEGVITGRLEHPNIVPVHMLGVDDEDRPVIVMKRVEGVAWSVLEKHQDVETVWSGDPMTKHLEIFLEVCNAVAFAHDRGYVHRDIKPSNVMIGHFGEVYLLDWGISTKVGTKAFDHVKGDGPGMPLGTPLYMAPEMCRTDGVISEATDVYLLGATLHRMLTGEFRHRANGLVNVLTEAIKSRPFPYGDEIPQELATICNKATSRRKDDRFPSVTALREAVVVFLRHRSSFELAREAEDILRTIEQHIDDDGDQREIRRRFTECRFAFMRALKDWGENERAQNGLQRCLEVMAQVELAHDNVDAAQALLDEMLEPDPALQERVDDKRANQAIQSEQVASLRRMAHELDPTVSRVPRALLALTFALLVAGTIYGQSLDEPLWSLTPVGAIYTMPPFIIVYVVAAIAFRNKLFATLHNKQVMILVGMGIAAMTVNRAVAIYANPPFEYMLGVDMFLIALLAAAAGATLDKAFYVPAAIWAAGFVGIVFVPNLPMGPYSLSQLGGLLALGWVFMRRKNRASEALDTR